MKKILLVSLLSLIAIPAFAANNHKEVTAKNTCPFCGKVFKKKSYLSRHLNTHINSEERIAMEAKLAAVRDEIQIKKEEEKAKKREQTERLHADKQRAIEEICIYNPSPNPTQKKGTTEYPWVYLTDGTMRCGFILKEGDQSTQCTFCVMQHKLVSDQCRKKLMKEHLAQVHDFASWRCNGCKNSFKTKEEKEDHKCTRKDNEFYDPFES